MKKLLAVLLGVCLILGVCVISFAAGSEKAAKDSRKLLKLLTADDEGDAEEEIGAILGAFLEEEAADEDDESVIGYIASEINTALAMYIMDKDAEDEGLNLIIAALISYWTHDSAPLLSALEYAAENYDSPKEIYDRGTPMWNILAADIETAGDGFNAFPLLEAAALDYLFAEDAGFAILPAVVSLAVHDEDPDDEYEELGFWLLVHIVTYLEDVTDDDDFNLSQFLLGGLLELAALGEFEEVSEDEYEKYIEEHVGSEELITYLLGLYD